MSRLTKVLGSSLSLLVAGVLGSAQLGAFSGNRPAGLGVHQGRLAACPDTPNCVSSFAPPGDEQHHVPAIDRVVDAPAAIEILRSMIAKMPRAVVMSVKDDYLHVEFESRLFRFVDDVEFYLPPDEPVVHVRSASRLGRSDFGANRRRVQELTRRYREAVAT